MDNKQLKKQKVTKQGNKVSFEYEFFPSTVPELPEEEYIPENHLMNIEGGGGTNEYGTGYGGRASLNIPVTDNLMLSPYITGGGFKPTDGPHQGNIGSYGIQGSYRFSQGGNIPPQQILNNVDQIENVLSKGTDTELAMLTPGENVVNAEASRMYQPIIDKMNEHGRYMQAAQGGPVPTYAAEGKEIPNFQTGFLNPLLQSIKQNGFSGLQNSIQTTLGRAKSEIDVANMERPTFTKEQDPRGVYTIGPDYKNESPFAYWKKSDGGPIYAKEGKQVADTSWITDNLLDGAWGAESSFGKNMLSDAGAIGHYQFMPDTITQPGFGVTPNFDPMDYDQSREAYKQYLTGIQNHYPDWTPQEVLQSVNWGPGRMSDYKEGWLTRENMPTETRNYPAAIASHMAVPEMEGFYEDTIPPSEVPWFSKPTANDMREWQAKQDDMADEKTLDRYIADEEALGKPTKPELDLSWRDDVSNWWDGYQARRSAGSIPYLKEHLKTLTTVQNLPMDHPQVVETLDRLKEATKNQKLEEEGTLDLTIRKESVKEFKEEKQAEIKRLESTKQELEKQGLETKDLDARIDNAKKDIGMADKELALVAPPRPPTVPAVQEAPPKPATEEEVQAFKEQAITENLIPEDKRVLTNEEWRTATKDGTVGLTPETRFVDDKNILEQMWDGITGIFGPDTAKAVANVPDNQRKDVEISLWDSIKNTVSDTWDNAQPAIIEAGLHYLASRVLGYNDYDSFNYAAKVAKNRITARSKEKAQLIKDGKYTTASIAEYMRTNNPAVLKAKNPFELSKEYKDFVVKDPNTGKESKLRGYWDKKAGWVYRHPETGQMLPINNWNLEEYEDPKDRSARFNAWKKQAQKNLSETISVAIDKESVNDNWRLTPSLIAGDARKVFFDAGLNIKDPEVENTMDTVTERATLMAGHWFKNNDEGQLSNIQPFIRAAMAEKFAGAHAEADLFIKNPLETNLDKREYGNLQRVNGVMEKLFKVNDKDYYKAQEDMKLAAYAWASMSPEGKARYGSPSDKLNETGFLLFMEKLLEDKKIDESEIKETLKGFKKPE
jgi:hypothetical protein